MAECIRTEHMMFLVDTQFKNPLINNFSKRIKDDALRIQKELKVTVPDEDMAEERMKMMNSATKTTKMKKKARRKRNASLLKIKISSSNLMAQSL